MTTLTSAKKGVAEQRLRVVSGCGARILDLLRDHSPIPESLRLELDAHIQHLPSLVISAEKFEPIDTLGTDLWNASAGLFHQDDRQHLADLQGKPLDDTRLGILVRVFAFLFLDTGYASVKKHADHGVAHIRIVKIALKAARLCLENSELNYALKVLERCAEHVAICDTDPAPGSEQSDGSIQVMCEALKAEYYLLRIVYAWKSDRLDTAHHFYIQFCSIHHESNDTMATKAADLFLCIAQSLTNSGEVSPASLWLERGLAALESCDGDDLADDAAQLRLSITSCLVGLLLSTKEKDHVTRARELVDALDSEFYLHNRVAVQALNFQVLVSMAPPLDTDQMNLTLTRIVKMTLLTESNFKMVMQMLNKASKFSFESAIVASDLFICTRLIPEVSTNTQEDNTTRDWLEKATVGHIHLLMTQLNTSPNIISTKLNQLLDFIFQCVGDLFTPVAIHACQALIWRIMQSAAKDRALEWCALLKHQLFERTSIKNKSRIGRKFILVALDNDDIVSAGRALQQMPIEARNETITRYLAFKIALRTQDYDLARQSLACIAIEAEHDAAFLYACVLDAQQSESRAMACLALQAVLKQRPPEIIKPALLRGIAHLLMTEIEGSTRQVNEIVDDIIDILDIAVVELPSSSEGSSNDGFSNELEWWIKNAYNLAIRIFSQIQPEQIIRLLEACFHLLSLHSSDQTTKTEDVKHRRMLLHFLAATALILTGRSQESSKSEHPLQPYVEARNHITIYKVIQSEINSSTLDELEVQRTLEMLKYDLESILQLEHWDSVDVALRACLDLHNVERWGTLADLLLILHQHLDRLPTDSDTSRLLTAVLQKIINETWRYDKDISKVARWLRCTFTICLPDIRSDFSFKLLEQAGTMAAHGADGRHDRYPEPELQWLAASGFNRAIDLISDGEIVTAERWMDGALELARWAQDNGSLHRVLTGKRQVARSRAAQYQKSATLEAETR